MKIKLVLAISVILSGCASNTVMLDSTENNPAVTQYPVAQALLNIYTVADERREVAMVDGTEEVGIVKITPRGEMLHDGKQVQGAEISSVYYIDGEMVGEGTSINFYTLDPVMFHGFNDDNGSYSFANPTKPIPDMAKVGDSDFLITENVYTDRSKTEKIESFTQSWSLSEATANTAWFCINTEYFDRTPIGNSAYCYEINANGDLLKSTYTHSARPDLVFYGQ